MKSYKTPELVSYKSKDILEIIGPTQSISVPLDVGGGWREASLRTNVMEYRNEGISPEIRLAKAGVKTIDEVIG